MLQLGRELKHSTVVYKRGNKFVIRELIEKEYEAIDFITFCENTHQGIESMNEQLTSVKKQIKYFEPFYNNAKKIRKTEVEQGKEDRRKYEVK